MIFFHSILIKALRELAHENGPTEQGDFMGIFMPDIHTQIVQRPSQKFAFPQQ